MLRIRITLKNGEKFFIKEYNKGLLLCNDLYESFSYKSELEFKVSWKLKNILKSFNGFFDFSFKEKVVKFESIDGKLNIKEFLMEENKPNKDIYVDKITFNNLKKAHFAWLRDVDGKSIHFPTEKDYDNVFSIRLLKRSFTSIFGHNWDYRYSEVYRNNASCLIL
jgi:hypothetical protein